MQKRLPRATVLLQLDEPSLPAVIAGRVPTESGLSAYRAVDGPDAATGLRTVVDGGRACRWSCTAARRTCRCRWSGTPAPWPSRSTCRLVDDLDPLGEALEAGLGLFAGAVATRPPAAGRAPTSKEVAERVRNLWNRLGFPVARLPQQVVVTPACGLAGAPMPYVRAVLTACREAGRRLAEV